MITIRQAVYEDIPNIMNFIDQHWKKNHILARDRSFFEWQFVESGQVNVFLGIDDKEGKIYGMQGIIRYNHRCNPDISGSIWKTIRSDNPRLGLDIADFANQQLDTNLIIGAGVSEKAIKLGCVMGGKPIAMDHYYRLADCEEYKIAVVKNKWIPQVKFRKTMLKPVSSIEEMKQVVSDEALANHLMSKDYDYIEWRYFKHPIYRYQIWKVVRVVGLIQSIVITREESWQGRKIIKIIDFYGDLDDLGRITPALDQLMKERGYEYVDIYSVGVPAAIYDRAGFVRCDENSENIIPSYFHPFEQRNVEIKMMDPMLEGLRLFRGDGDQDRPC